MLSDLRGPQKARAVCSAFGLFSFAWQLPHLRLGRMQSEIAECMSREYPACIATVSGHHQSDVCSDLMKRLQLPDSSFFPRYHMVIIFPVSILSSPWMSPVCPLRSIFLLHTMLSMILFFQLFLKPRVGLWQIQNSLLKIITSLIAPNHRNSCWSLFSALSGGGRQEGAEKRYPVKRPFCFITNIEQNRNCSRFS